MEFSAFLSYARVDDDDNSGGVIAQLLNLIEAEGRQVTGQKEFEAFRDKKHIGIGDDFQKRIDIALEQSSILIALITPAYFESRACLHELQTFLEKENELGRQDLIIPVYFTEANDMSRSDEAMKSRPEDVRHASRIFKQRQYIDFRDFRRVGFFNKDGTFKEGVTEGLLRIGSAIKTAYRITKAQNETDIRQTITKLPFEPDETSSNTHFNNRLNHFKQEKEYLADKFGDYLLARLENFCKNRSQNVLLFIDSGSTLFHFFKKIGAYAQYKKKTEQSSWIDNLTIVTNNLEGALSLMKDGRISNEMASDIAIQCIILPGVPSPTYSAIVTPSKESQFYDLLSPTDTVEVIRNIADKAKRNDAPDHLNNNRMPTKIISLISGNWVRIRQSVPKMALPLSRRDGILEIKQTLIDISDEVYLIAPLGKIFAGHSKDSVYAVLQQYINKSHPGQPSYKEAKYSFNTATPNKIRLITTYRAENDILSDLSDLLARDDFIDAQKISKLDINSKIGPFQLSSDFQFVSNLMFEFSYPATNIETQLRLEFPHSASRYQGFISMFHVNRSVLDLLE